MGNETIPETQKQNIKKEVRRTEKTNNDNEDVKQRSTTLQPISHA